MEPDDKKPSKPETKTYEIIDNGVVKSTKNPDIEIKIPDVGA